MRWIDYFDRGWEINPHGPCLIDDDAEDAASVYSYTDIRDLTLRIAGGLMDGGFERGRHGAVLSFNHPLSVAATLAIMRAGLVWVPLNPRNGLADNAALLASFDCDILFFHSDFADSIELFREHAPGIQHFVCLDADREDGSLNTFITGQAAVPRPFDYDPLDTVMMAGTGGTTGAPKGVMQTHRGTNLQTLLFMATMPFRKRPVYLAVAPLTHATGYLTYPVFAQGGTVVIQRAPNIRRLLDAIPKHGISLTFLPPTVIYSMLSEPGIRDVDFSSLDYFAYGASPMSPSRLREAIEVVGPVFLQVFGQTETLFPLTWLPREDHFVDRVRGGEVVPDERLRTCGRAAPGVTMAIMSPDGALLPDTEVGELVCRTEMVMKGYYQNADATAEANAHDWFHTGDLGFRDGAGYFYIVDRAKDMIITGGFNVYSSEVEAAVLTHPAVQECAVIGVPDEKWGEAIKAVVELKPGEQLDADALIVHCKAAVGSVKAPKSVDFIAEIPRSPVGKVLKRELRDRYWAGKDRQVG
jgi:acyl-CoA synthetase (AMP-forming)/AMP-acid ligase II